MISNMMQTSAFFPPPNTPPQFYFWSGNASPCESLIENEWEICKFLQTPTNFLMISCYFFNGWSFATPRSLGCWIQRSYCASLWNVWLFHEANAHTWSWASTQSLQSNRETLTFVLLWGCFCLISFFFFEKRQPTTHKYRFVEHWVLQRNPC